MINIILYSFSITKGIKSVGPRALLDINNNKNHTLIVQQINNLHKIFQHKRYHIYLIVGYQKEKIISILNKNKLLDKKLSIIHHDDYHNYGEAWPIVSAVSSIPTGHTIVIGDGVLMSSIEIPKVSSIYKLPKKKNFFNIGLTENNKQTQYLCYDLESVWAEISFFAASDIENIVNTLNTHNINSIFWFEAINILIENGICIHSVPIRYNSINKFLTTKVTQKI